MQWSDISFQPANRIVRQFAAGLLALLGGLACWEEFANGNRTWALVLVILAVVLGLGGSIFPRFLRPIFVLWMVLAFPIGWTVSQLVLVIIFYGIFTPISFIFRLCGRDVLGRRKHDCDTYWQPKTPAKDVRAYFRQS